MQLTCATTTDETLCPVSSRNRGRTAGSVIHRSDPEKILKTRYADIADDSGSSLLSVHDTPSATTWVEQDGNSLDRNLVKRHEILLNFIDALNTNPRHPDRSAEPLLAADKNQL